MSMGSTLMAACGHEVHEMDRSTRYCECCSLAILCLEESSGRMVRIRPIVGGKCGPARGSHQRQRACLDRILLLADKPRGAV